MDKPTLLNHLPFLKSERSIIHVLGLYLILRVTPFNLEADLSLLAVLYSMGATPWRKTADSFP